MLRNMALRSSRLEMQLGTILQALKSEMAKVNEKMPLFSSMASSLKYFIRLLRIFVTVQVRRSISWRRLNRLGWNYFKVFRVLKNWGRFGKFVFILTLLPTRRTIATLDVSRAKSATTQARLNRTVGQFARHFVQQNLPPLRVLPSESEHRQLVQKRTTLMAPKPLEVNL